MVAVGLKRENERAYFLPFVAAVGLLVLLTDYHARTADGRRRPAGARRP